MSGQLTVPYARNRPREKFSSRVRLWFLVGGGLVILLALLWQGITAHGAPDPTVANTNRFRGSLILGYSFFEKDWNVSWFSLPYGKYGR